MPKILLIYQTESGKTPFKEWLHSVRDRIFVARINARLARIEQGNFGDTKSVGQQVMELRLSFGSGFRIYFGLDGETLVVLLAGGDKASQSRDIELAHEYWKDYVRRTDREKNK